jgi:hypothetical protein
MHRSVRQFGLGLALVVLLPFVASNAWAASYGFGCISGNIAGDCAIGEAQLLVDVTDAGGGQVLFTFSNSGPEDSSITDVYFDDGTLLGIASIVNTVGTVEFSQNATPEELPAANNASPPFVTTAGFSADSVEPVQPLGVNPGETLGIVFDLIGGQTFADTLGELAAGTLRIGIHVQGYYSGGSESFVNVPEPSTALLISIGLVGLAARRRSQLR